MTMVCDARTESRRAARDLPPGVREDFGPTRTATSSSPAMSYPSSSGRREPGQLHVVQKVDGTAAVARGGDGPEVLTDFAAVTVAHWDEVEFHRSAGGDGRGVAVARPHCRRQGRRRGPCPRQLPASCRLLPFARVSEELFFVLAGSGLAWQDGDVHEVRPLDCVDPPRRTEMGTRSSPAPWARVPRLRHAPPDGVRLATRAPAPYGSSRPWVEGRDNDPWDIEATVEPLAVGGRRHVHQHRQRGRGRARAGRTRSRPATARDTASVRNSPGSIRSDSGTTTRGTVPHCHSCRGGGLRHPRRDGNARALATGTLRSTRDCARPATWSRRPPARASRTPSTPARTA